MAYEACVAYEASYEAYEASYAEVDNAQALRTPASIGTRMQTRMRHA